MPDLISAIHGCALQPENWPDALEGLFGHLDGSGGILWSHPATPDAFGLRVPCRLHPESLAEYVHTYQQQDDWMQAGLAKGLRAGEVLTDERLVPRATLIRSAFYRDFLQRFDYEHLLLAVLHRQGDAEGMHAMPTVCLAIVRGQADAPFGAGERKKLLALLPHLQHATAVNFQLAERDRRLSVAQAAVDLFCDALFFTDRSEHVVHTNQAAKRLLADRDGLRLRNHRLAAEDPKEDRSLQCLFEAAEAGGGRRRVCCASPAQAASRHMSPRA